jgi:hypothetical protein
MMGATSVTVKHGHNPEEGYTIYVFLDSSNNILDVCYADKQLKDGISSDTLSSLVHSRKHALENPYPYKELQ